MAKRKIQTSTEPQEQQVDVTAEETHFSVQCEDVRLITSMLKPLVVDKDKDISTRYAFRIHAIIEGLKAYSYLEVKVNYFYTEEESDLEGFNLSFALMGTFGTASKMPQEAFINFVKMYTLTILWPYAREYVSDQLRRAGSHECILPIINPQVVTENIIENNLVEVEVLETSEQAK
jgi:preprotein translocase subunit SecB